MSTRFYQIMLLAISALCVALVTSAFTPTPPPKTTLPACESIPDVKLGEKGIISCTGFTPNGDVKVIFNRPDTTTSEDVGKADKYGNFDGRFTVDIDRPAGFWTLYLIDLSTAQMVSTPFTVIPLVTPSQVPPSTEPPEPPPSAEAATSPQEPTLISKVPQTLLVLLLFISVILNVALFLRADKRSNPPAGPTPREWIEKKKAACLDGSIKAQNSKSRKDLKAEAEGAERLSNSQNFWDQDGKPKNKKKFGDYLNKELKRLQEIAREESPGPGGPAIAEAIRATIEAGLAAGLKIG